MARSLLFLAPAAATAARRLSRPAAPPISRLRVSLALPAIFLGLLLILPLPASAQSSVPPPTQDSHPPVPTQSPLRVSSELVKIDASVSDSHGAYVGDLQQSDFRVLVDGADAPILFFAPAEEPARILVLVEVSPAVYLIQTQYLAAAYALLDGLSAEDQVALFTYDSAAHGLLSFTADKGMLAQALGTIQYTLGSGQLNFYLSLAQVLDWESSVEGKKAAVLLTTGLDSSDPSLWPALLQKLRSSDTVIYPVALGGSLRGYTGKKKSRKKKDQSAADASSSPSDSSNPLSFAKANIALKSIAETTGGRAYFPASAADFIPDYREIASALRHQYLLGIAPLHDGKFHTISVELRPGLAGPAKKDKRHPPAFTIYARSGYLAPAP